MPDLKRAIRPMTEPTHAELAQYRAQIDRIDEELIDALARRFEIVHAVGRLKAQKGLAVVQPQRALAVMDRAAALGREKGLDPDFVKRLYQMMIDHAHSLEHDIATPENG